MSQPWFGLVGVAAGMETAAHGGVAMLAGLSRPPAGDTYQICVIADGKASSAAVLPVGVSGGTMPFDWAPGADTFGITFEPVGGSPSPTMAHIATITLA